MKHSVWYRHLVIVVVFAGLIVLAGCSGTVPAGATGVLSSIQQKTLNLATKRAMDAAAIDAAFLGENKYYLRFGEIGQADIGKQHVSGAIRSEFLERGAQLVEDLSAGDCTLVCRIHVAGIDTRPGLFWPLFKWIDTRGEVDLTVEKKCDSILSSKRGAETAKFNQLWVLGIGPSESIK